MKRELELYKMVEAAVMDGEQELKERGMIRDLLELQKRMEEEDEARGLIEEMQRNLDEAQNRSYEVERKLDQVLWEYIEASDNGQGRPQFIVTKLWQMMQSRDTKYLNLDKDFDAIMTKKNRPDGTSLPGRKDSGRKREMMTSSNRHVSVSSRR